VLAIVFKGNSLLSLAVLVAVGLTVGNLVRRLRLPAVTGQILAGVILGPSLLGWVSHDVSRGLQPVVHFALGLVAVAVGSHLHLHRLGTAGRRLRLLLAAECLLVPAFVILAVRLVGRTSWPFGLLLGALAVSTAPATIVAIVKETRSRGVFVSTLLMAVALNNIACIALFEMTLAAVAAGARGGAPVTLTLVTAPLIQLAGAALLGASAGALLVVLTRHVTQPEQLTAASLVSIFLTVGAADAVGFSPLLACLSLGATISNVAPAKEEIGHRVFANFEPAILATFFILAGVELDLHYLAPAALLVAAVVLARAAGKMTAAWLAMRAARTTRSLRRNLGLALIPQAGVAVGLLLKLRESAQFELFGELFLAVGVTTVALNEIVGPLTTRWALARSGEMGKDRPRLIDFLHEENIVTDFAAAGKEEAIAKLADLLVRSHRLTGLSRDTLLADVLARERAMSTCIGRGLFVPHAEIEGLDRLCGVMAVSRAGLAFPAPDDQPIQCIVLLAIPPRELQRHVQVQAALARSIGSDPAIRAQLFEAGSPAHVCEILHAGEFEDYNYFLEEPVL
jgi:PTS system fructose-specific IIC component